MRSAAPTTRRKRAVESFQSAAECIGPIELNMSLFAITRGQWSMIDAILHCLSEVGPSVVSLWTWTIAEYEVQCLERLQMDGNVTDAVLVIDKRARNSNASIIENWQSKFGPDSVRFCVNHAKIATIESADRKLLLRGSMNLNFNPRFEQFDITEGGEDFDLVKKIESELQILGNDFTGAQAHASSRVTEAFDREQLELFEGIKTWAK